ncbi:MAG: DUF3105 domain-containing protein [Actinomycetota bacterium]
MSKKLQQKQARRQAEEKRRAELRKAQFRRNAITIGLAIVIGGAAVFIIIQNRTPSSANKGSSVGGSVSAADCTDIANPKLLKGLHIPVGQTHRPYTSTPPTSGPHYAAPAGPVDPGFYSDALQPEAVLHNEEHGMIVFWYRADAPSSVIDKLQKIVDQQPAATVAVPYDQVPPGESFSMTAWGHIQSCHDVAQTVVDKFRTLYQGKGPEQVGVPTFQG